MSVLRNVAKEAGVSISTVSLVINNKPGVSQKTRLKVISTFNQLGYQDYLSRLAKDKIQKSIQFVLYKKHGQIVSDTPFFSSVLEGVEEQVKKIGYNLLVSYVYEGQGVMDQVKALKANNSAGLILLATEMSHQDIEPFRMMGIPLVVLDSYFEEIIDDTVVINNVQGAFMATRHLLDMGHTEVGYLRSKVLINNFFERRDGFHKALAYRKVPFHKEYEIPLGASAETAYEDMRLYLLKKPKLPTAFFADNDLIAIGAMRALREAGFRIPEDVSLIGFDDIPICTMIEVPLTTICVPKCYIGKLAVERLVDVINNGDVSQIKVEVCTQLVERSSVRNLGEGAAALEDVM